MSAASFPLFRPVAEDIPDDPPGSISDLLDREVRRAALVGSDPDADERLTLTVDLPATAVDALQALATATGSSRRAMGSKLLTAAVWQAVQELHHFGQGERAVGEYEAVLEHWVEAYNDARAARK